MIDILVTFLFFVGFFLLMSVGYFTAHKVLKGTCGGLGAIMGKCDICESKEDCKDAKQ
jgi:hypothetical protein